MKMYYVAVYDIASEKRLPKVLKTFRKYLFWIQNSVFEGELNEAQFKSLKDELKRIIKNDTDSILYFSVENKKYVTKSKMGIEKNEPVMFI